MHQLERMSKGRRQKGSRGGEGGRQGGEGRRGEEEEVEDRAGTDERPERREELGFQIRENCMPDLCCKIQQAHCPA